MEKYFKLKGTNAPVPTKPQSKVSSPVKATLGVRPPKADKSEPPKASSTTKPTKEEKK